MQSKADIERLIGDSELRIISLDLQIKQLVELRDRERACVAALRNLISPIRNLPIELLAEIFELSIDDVTHIQDVFRISQVCSHWRQATHNTPRLWTRPLQVDLRKSQNSREDGLNIWLARSTPLPVTITLLLGSRSTAINHRLLEEALSISSRWRYLHLKVVEGPRQSSPLSLVSLLGKCKLDRLEELDLGSDALDRDIDHPLLFPSFNDMPRLRSLTICIESNSVCMPWGQLINLHLESEYSPVHALDILAQCANLTTASVTIPGFVSEVGQDIITLPKLHTLSVEYFGHEEHVTPFFSSLSAPALKTLSLGFGNMQRFPQWTERQFTEFQLRAPDITRLEFSFGEFTPEDLTTAIRHAPSLAELELKHCSFDDTVARALYYEDGVKPLASCLHHLVLHQITALTADILAGMLVSRWWTDSELATRLDPPAVARWTYVKITGFTGQRRNRMAVLQSEGLPIRRYGGRAVFILQYHGKIVTIQERGGPRSGPLLEHAVLVGESKIVKPRL